MNQISSVKYLVVGPNTIVGVSQELRVPFCRKYTMLLKTTGQGEIAEVNRINTLLAGFWLASQCQQGE